MKKIALFYFSFFSVLVMDAQSLWKQKSNFPSTVRIHGGSFVLKNEGYIVGGAFSPTTYTDEVWKYSPTTDTWQNMSALPGGDRYLPVCFVINNVAYAGLGLAGSSSNQLYKYNDLLDTWTRVTDFPSTARYASANFVIGNSAYFACGSSGGSPYYDELWEYNSTLDTWTQKASLPGGTRVHPMAFVINNRPYLAGGTESNFYDDLWEYLPGTNTWTQRASFSGGRSTGLGLGVYNTGWLICGYNGTEMNEVLQYNQNSDTWTKKADFSGPARHAAFGFVLNNKPYVIMGNGNSGYLNDVWMYDSTSVTTSIRSLDKTKDIYATQKNQQLTFVNVNQENPGFLKGTIFNYAGVEVRNFEGNSISTEGIAAGVYFYQLQLTDRIVNGRVVINH